MGDMDALTKARKELQALYHGVSDESVNLTFRHLTDIKLHPHPSFEKKKENSSNQKEAQTQITQLSKLPSLDFNRALQEANQHSRPHVKISLHPSAQVGAQGLTRTQTQTQTQTHGMNSTKSDHLGEFRPGVDNSMVYNDDISQISMYQNQRGGVMGRSRPGIPHSNICTNCSTYIYIFRHRCLVCGRVYCRNCVVTGMGEMTEGRKCLDCVGRKFSHRYIVRAGDVGCCRWRYSNRVKQAELKWAEKGPRRKGEISQRRGYSGFTNSSMATPTSGVGQSQSQSQSHWAANSVDGGNASFVSYSRFTAVSSPYSPAHRHHIPF